MKSFYIVIAFLILMLGIGILGYYGEGPLPGGSVVRDPVSGHCYRVVQYPQVGRSGTYPVSTDGVEGPGCVPFVMSSPPEPPTSPPST